MDRGAAVEGNREDGPPVIIGVLAQQVDAAGCRRASCRRRAEHLAKECFPGLSRSLFRHSAVPVRRKPACGLAGARCSRPCCCPPPAEAQLAPLGIPRGMFRFEIDGSFAYANERFNDGTRESLGANFTSPGARLRPDPHARGGRPAHRGAAGPARLQAGSRCFDRHGAGVERHRGVQPRHRASPRGSQSSAALPFVSTWWRQTVSIDTATSNAGVNLADPAIGNTAGASVAAVLLQQVQHVAGRLEATHRVGRCTTATRPRRRSRIQTLASGVALSDSLSALITDAGTASPFLPLASSSAGQTLSGQVTSVQQALDGLGVPGSPPRCRCRPTPRRPADLDSYATSPAGPIGYSSLRQQQAHRHRRRGSRCRVHRDRPLECRCRARGLRLAAIGTVRLPTGAVALPTDPFGVSLGAGTPAVGIGLALDLGGGTFGARFSARLPAADVGRLHPPGRRVHPRPSLRAAPPPT